MENEDTWIIGEQDNSENNKLLCELFSEGSMLFKEGPYSRNDAVKNYEKSRANTFPLYVATKNSIEYYLFY